MGLKIEYECGCVANISPHNIYMRYVSCSKHMRLDEWIRPATKEDLERVKGTA